MTALRVLHVLDHALPEVSGYSVRSHNVLRAQRACGIDAVGLAQSPSVEQVVEGAIDGIPYIWVPRQPPNGAVTLPTRLARLVRMARQVRHEVSVRRMDLVHAHSPSPNGLAALCATTGRRVPLVYEMRGLWEETAVGRNLRSNDGVGYRASRALETWLIRRVSMLVVISQGLRGEALRRGVVAENVVCVPNGVDTRWFHPMPPDADLARQYDITEHIVFGYIGFFSAYEGIDVLVRAFARVAADLPKALLVLVGLGDQENLLRKLAIDLGIASRVIFAGSVKHEDVRRWYSVCDVLVYPRRLLRLTTLVTPLKPLEAMAMAKPVVASAVGGLQELIEDGETGLLCAPDDPAALAAALTALAADEPRRTTLAANARRMVEAQRDWTYLGPLYETVYRRLLSPAPARVP